MSFKDRLACFLEHFKMIRLNQYDFIKGKCLVVSLAFDTIDHNLLLTKLDQVGTRGTIRNWVASYLKDKSQYVNDMKSDVPIINRSVPQGSILRPMLFYIFHV